MVHKKPTPAGNASAAPATTRRRATPPAQVMPSPVVADSAPETPKLKQKLVRDSFTIPKSEYAVLDALKQRATQLKRPVKKGEILRAGIAALARLSDNALVAALNAVPSLKTGRPKNAEPPATPASPGKAAVVPANRPVKKAKARVAKTPAEAVKQAAKKQPKKSPNKLAEKVPTRAETRAGKKAVPKP